VKYWNLLKDRALMADVVLTSDTVALSRIFLQNKFPGKLVIWICNRFDYVHGNPNSKISSKENEKYAGEHPDSFPSAEFYNLIRSAAMMPNIAIVGYTKFENNYALVDRNVNVGNEIIKPTGFAYRLDKSKVMKDGRGSVPATVVKEETFFIPPYLNDERVPEKCKYFQIKCYRGRYAGPNDIKDFKGIIHVPYAWSNLALFEMLALGVPYFIPSIQLLTQEKNIFWTPPYDLNRLVQSEWYDPEMSHLFVFFDKWEDLPGLISSVNLTEKRQLISAYGKSHEESTVKQWKSLIYRL